jgi:hypothetical protein
VKKGAKHQQVGGVEIGNGALLANIPFAPNMLVIFRQLTNPKCHQHDRRYSVIAYCSAASLFPLKFRLILIVCNIIAKHLNPHP